MNDHWDGLELRHLETLRAIARSGSFRGAADDIGHAQSVVSQQLLALEAIVGMRLVDRQRGRRTVTLTRAGEALLRHADAIDARLGAARADLRAIADGTSGTLRVGTFQSVSARILPEVLRRFSAQWPGIALQVREGMDDRELMPLVESGDLDLAFSSIPLADGPFEATEILRDTWHLLAQAGSPLAARGGRVALPELRDETLVAFGAASGLQSSLEDYLRGIGVSPRIVFRTNDNAAIQALAGTGFGVALLPALAIDFADPRTVAIPVEIPDRSIVITWHADRDLTPAASAFIELSREVCAAIDPAGP